MAFVFGSTADDELYPFLTDDGSDVPLSPDEQALLMGMYPGANLTDFDFSLIGPNGVVQQHHAPQAHTAADAAAAGAAAVLTVPQNSASPTSIHKIPTPNGVATSVAVNGNGRNNMPGLQQPAYYDSSQYQPQHQFNPTSRRSEAHSPNAYSPSSSSLSDSGIRDSEDILRAPVKSLNEEEKKLRRRAQVAKSARKHRNRQKEELSRLREQVQFLQEQMALMHVQGTPTSAGGNVVANGNGNGNTDTDMEKKPVIQENRKRKKMDDSAPCRDDGTLETALTNQPAFATAAQRMLQNSMRAMVASSTILHGRHHLPADTLERARMLLMISTKRAQSARQYLHNQFGNRVVHYPTMDIKLNSNGPEMEIQLVRAKILPGFTHLEVADAAWNSIYDFNLAIPTRFKRYVTCERLMELDENTRYGRTIAPLLKNREENFIVYMHSYFVVHKAVFDDCAIFTWESILEDDLYPFEASDTAIRNDEIGCMILETETLPNGDVQSRQRTVIHSTPPIAAITEPRGRLNEAFLTVFCRNADILETSARLYLRDKYPERTIKSEFEYVNE